MSRNLPQFPNLDYLKKRAKSLLRELQRRNPGAKLTQAQHAIAREYGFASWPKLKAHVESLPRPANRSRANADVPRRAIDRPSAPWLAARHRSPQARAAGKAQSLTRGPTA